MRFFFKNCILAVHGGVHQLDRSLELEAWLEAAFAFGGGGREVGADCAGFRDWQILQMVTFS